MDLVFTELLQIRGQLPADNSGILRYVRIEYAGYAFLPDNGNQWLNIWCVGTGTVVE